MNSLGPFCFPKTENTRENILNTIDNMNHTVIQIAKTRMMSLLRNNNEPRQHFDGLIGLFRSIDDNFHPEEDAS